MNENANSLTVGRVTGFRGAAGELTVRVASGDAARWTGMRSVGLRLPAPGGDLLSAEIESSRAYRDRLVLKIRGVDDAQAANRLRGALVEVPPEDVPALPDGVYWVSRLIGSAVTDGDGDDLGRVEDVLETGGTDVLVVRGANGRETLIPLAREIVTEIDEASAMIRVSLPDGLRDMNERGAIDGSTT